MQRLTPRRGLLPQSPKHGLEVLQLHAERTHRLDVRVPLLPLPPVRIPQVPAFAGSPGGGRGRCLRDRVQEQAQDVVDRGPAQRVGGRPGRGDGSEAFEGGGDQEVLQEVFDREDRTSFWDQTTRGYE